MPHLPRGEPGLKANIRSSATISLIMACIVLLAPVSMEESGSVLSEALGYVSFDAHHAYDILVGCLSNLGQVLGSTIQIPPEDGPDIRPTDGPNTIVVYIKGDEVIAENSSGVIVLRGQAKAETVNVIQSAMDLADRSEGGKVHLRGTLSAPAASYLLPPDGMVIEGIGGVVQLNNIGINVTSKSNVTLRSLYFTGNASHAVYISEGSNNTLLENLTATLSADSWGVFLQYPKNGVINNTRFINCRAVDCGGFGFINHGGEKLTVNYEGGPIKLVKNSEYINCTALRCGISSRNNDWVVGFDMAEGCDIENVLLLNCTAVENWESGFHVEDPLNKTNVRLINCTSSNNGLSKPSPLFGSGFNIAPGMSLIRCSSSGNIVGYRAENYEKGLLLMDNCTDVKSERAIHVLHSNGRTVINNFTSLSSTKEGVLISDCDDIYVRGLYIIDPAGDTEHNACAVLDDTYGGDIEVSASGGSRETFLLIKDSLDLMLKGRIKTASDYALAISGGANISVEDLILESGGVGGIRASSDTSDVHIARTEIESVSKGKLDYGILVTDTAIGGVTVDRSSVAVSNSTIEPFSGCKFPKNWGTAIIARGTDSVVVEHDLISEPRIVSCKGQSFETSHLYWIPVGDGKEAFKIYNRDASGMARKATEDQEIHWMSSV